MKIAIVGSRNLSINNIDSYVAECDEIVSGGANGVDTSAAEYAKRKNIKLTEFLPEYSKYGRAAPIVRNKQIVDYSDKILVFWNGNSNGTRSVIEYAKKIGRECDIIIVEK